MNQRFDEQTYYEILEISPESAEHEVHKAYQKAKKTYSPESPALYTMFTPDEATELARLIEEAYAVLSNHTSRREYDNRILGRSTSAQQPQTPPRQVHRSANENAKSDLRAKNMMPIDKGSSSSQKTPDGHLRSKYGVYEADSKVEEEIKTCENFSGGFLNKIRTYKKIDLETLSQDIRVSKTYLNAVEKDDYSSLPAEVFVRGFIVQVAKALGLEPEKVAKSYMKTMRDAKVK